MTLPQMPFKARGLMKGSSQTARPMGWVSPLKGEQCVWAIARRRLLTSLMLEMDCFVAGVPMLMISCSP